MFVGSICYYVLITSTAITEYLGGRIDGNPEPPSGDTGALVALDGWGSCRRYS